jgi:hypothetical protein
LEAVITLCEIGPWQHEWELGIAEVLHRPAIFRQHALCSAFICAADVRHAERGAATTISASETATSCANLCNIFILLPSANRTPLSHKSNQVIQFAIGTAFPSQVRLRKAALVGKFTQESISVSSLLLLPRLRHVLVERNQCIRFLGLFFRQFSKLLAVPATLSESVSML